LFTTRHLLTAYASHSAEVSQNFRVTLAFFDLLINDASESFVDFRVLEVFLHELVVLRFCLPYFLLLFFRSNLHVFKGIGSEFDSVYLLLFQHLLTVDSSCEEAF
jgi:hypothetical protein